MKNVFQGLKIVLLNHNQIGQGTYFRCYHFGKELVKLGHRVTLLTTSRKHLFNLKKTVDNGLEIIEFPDFLRGKLRNGFCPWNTLRRIFFLHNKEFDIIHAFDSRPVVIFPALFLKYKGKVPLIMDWPDWWGHGGTIKERSGHLYTKTVGRIEIFFEEYFRKYADRATTICTALRKRLEGLGYPANKITTIHQSCDFEKIKPLAIEYCRKNLSLSFNDCIIGHLGTLFKNDAQLLFDTMNYVRSHNRNIKLLLIGRHKLRLKDFECDPELLIETGEISDSEISYYLGASDILVLPMRNTIANNGRWPSKINDYMAAAKPIVSTPISDIKTIINDRGIGVLAEDNSVDFGKAIMRLLDDKKRRKYLGERARKYAENHLNWKILTKRLEDVYRSGLGLQLERIKEKTK